MASLPVLTGTAGKSRLTNTTEVYDATRMVIRSEGRSVVVPSGFLDAGGLALSAQLLGVTVFDAERGQVTEAVWKTEARPTAQSGPLARPFESVTRLRALDQEEAVSLPPTQAFTPVES